MSENQYLEIIENKIDDITKMVEQQAKSGVFFDGFTKQVLEKIHNQLEYISNFESNELITYLSDEMKNTLDERESLLQQKLDDVQNSMEKIKGGLNESIKTPEVLQIFNKLSDSVVDFSHDLNAQTKYFNATIESIQQEISKVRLDGRLEEQTASIKSEINTYKASLNNLGADINSGFANLKRSIEDNGQNENLVALSGDISVIQNGLNDVINAVLTMNSKQGEMLATVSNISTNVDTSDIRSEVSSMLVEIQAIKDSFRILVNKSDIEALNEKVNYAIEVVSNVKELTSFNDKENKTIFQKYFNDLNNLLSSLVSKEEGEFIKNKLDFIQAAVEAGRQDVREVLQDNSQELKNLIPFISSLSTKENVQELSENAINSLSSLAEQWNQTIAEYANSTENKIETFRRTLSNIHEVLDTISSKVESSGLQGGVSIKEEVNNILNSVNEMSERLASSTQNSIIDLSKHFAELSNLIVVKTSTLEQVVNTSQDGLKSDLSGNIDQLKEFTQSLVSAISVFNNKIDSKSDEIKSILIDKYDDLSKKVNDLSNLYATSSFEQKTQLLSGIDMLKATVESVKGTAVDSNMVDEINNKINQVSELLQLGQETLLESNNKFVESISTQTNILDIVNNGIKDVYTKISDFHTVSASYKEEIINDLANKIYSVVSIVEEAKNQVFGNFDDNKNQLQEEFFQLKSSTEDIKNLLNEVNQNQTSKELSTILDNVTDKLESVSSLITTNKDFNLEQYNTIKQLTSDLKTEINEVVINLNQSSEFAKNLMDRMSAGFVETSENLLKQTSSLKNDILNITGENKLELTQKIDAIEDLLKNVQIVISGLNFDESVKEQLIALKQQIESFNQQSFIDILNKVTENNEQIGTNVTEVINNIKYRFDELFNQVELIQNQEKALQDIIAQGLADNLNEITQSIELFTEKVKLFGFDNKEQILREIDVLKNSTNDVQYSINAIAEKLPQSDTISAQINTLDSNLNNFVDILQTSGIENKERILQEITVLKMSAVELQEKINEINEAILKETSISEQVNSINNAINTFEEKLVATENTNKEQIIQEIYLLKNSLEDMQSRINIIGDNQPLREFFVEQLGRMKEVISNYNETTQSSNTANKEELSQKVDALRFVIDGVYDKLNSILEKEPQDNILVEQTDRINEIINTFTNNLRSINFGSQEQLAQSINDIKVAIDDNQVRLNTIADNQPQKEYILEQSNRIGEVVNNLIESMHTFGNETKDAFEQKIDTLRYVVDDVQIRLSDLAEKQTQKDYIQEQADKLDATIREFANSLQTSENNDKEQILQEIDILKNSANDVQYSINTIADKIPQNEFILEQTGKINELISAFADKVSTKLNEINDSDKGYVTYAVKEAFGELQDQMAESINYLKGLTLNLDRSLAGSKNAILESVDMLKENANKSIDAVNVAKNEILTQIDTVSNNINEKLDKANQIENSVKDEIITQLSNATNENTVNLKSSFELKLQDTFDKFNEKIAFLTGSFQTSSTRNRDEILETVESLKNSAFDIKNDVNILLEKARTEMQNTLNQGFAAGKTNLEEKINLLTQDLSGMAVNNKEQILSNMAELKGALLGLQENGQTAIERNNQFIKDEVGATVQNAIQNTLDKISDLSDKLQNNSSTNKEEIITQVNLLKSNLNDYKVYVDNLSANIETIKNMLSADLSERINIFNNKATDFITEIKQSSLENEAQIIDKLEEIKDFSSDIKSEVNNLFIEKFDNLLQNIKDTSALNKSEILNSIEKYKEELQNTNNEIINLTEKVSENNEKTEAFSNEVKQLLGTSLAEVTNVLSTGKTEAAEFQAELKFELKRSIDEITTKLFRYDEDSSTLRDALIFELQKTYNVLSEKIEQQKDKVENVQNTLNENIENNTTNVKEHITNSIFDAQSNIVKTIAEELNFEELKSNLCQEVLSNTGSLTAKLDELSTNLSENNELFITTTKVNKNDIIEQINLLKTDVINLNADHDTVSVVQEIKKIEEKIESLSDDILDALSNDLDASFTDNFKTITETIEDKISFVKDDIQEVVLKISEIDSIIEKVKDVVVVQFEDYFQTFDSKINTLSEDIKKYFDKNIEKITTTIDEYKQELNSLNSIDLNGYSEETKVFVQDQIAEIKEKLDELQNSDGLDNAIEDINETIINSTDVIAKNIEAVKNSILTEVASNEPVIEKIDDIQATLNDINTKTQNITSVVKEENTSLKEVIEQYQESINAISNVDLSSYKDDSKEVIVGELKHVKEQIIRTLASVFENISFIEEAEEIQNSICDSTDYIRDEIYNLKNELIANSNSNDDVDEKFNNLKTILESITTGTTTDSEKYVYTLPDVEADIAKMRMAISDITSMLKQNQDEDNGVAERLDSIDEIKEDISSISKRTNKLILTSEDANKHLKDNLAEFKRVVDEVAEKCNTLSSGEIKRNLLDTKALVVSGLKSNKILNEAFMHLAEWIDDSATTMNSIASQVEDNKDNLKTVKYDLNGLEDRTQEIKDAIADLTLKFDKKLDVDYTKFLYDIECGLDKLNDKLEVQELKIKSLEKKLDNMSNAPTSSDEVTSVLEYIASQVSAANENSRSNKLLLQKVEMMEKQINQFETSISKITEFIDGAN